MKSGTALARHSIDILPGEKFEPVGKLARLVFEELTEAPDGPLMGLRTVWKITSLNELRFITAVPLTD
ncbi:hypothetical protein [Methylobacterium gnaphalii]|uniref:Uncharacterized protein n=1 Tax=Methylobacterium gnaphalii TaxID=1010610 RepID=A0A512JQC8_9HYPH|nr:hypothetical protein [Methylobacterium gnaphalii]GEP12166.1 hypothetical protein MGN01_40110 [Methylobacterium gnaphalii]GJD71685.1 hypothetical protein MMMDOFMJ_4648 [Methylobacterium gnaphalii]GLS48837.1 hypothetical protein GCM10007885_16840 [Methylobacterium gnaphalii]